MKFIKVILSACVDIVILTLSIYGSMYLKFDGFIPLQYKVNFQKFFVYFVLMKVVVLVLFQLYKIIWKYAGIKEMFRIINASFVSNILLYFINTYFSNPLPRSVLPLILILDIFLLGSYRMVPRLFQDFVYGSKPRNKRIIIVGAGEAGTALLKDIRKNPSYNYEPVCFVDDNPEKKGKIIGGLVVESNIDSISSLVERYSVKNIILAIPSLTGLKKKELLEKITIPGVNVLTMPGLKEIQDVSDEIFQVRNISIGDLLGREEVQLDHSYLRAFLQDRVVLISGGGGSIGSELARQVADYLPKKLLLLDIYENNVYELQNQLLRQYPKLDVTVLIESVRDRSRLEEVLKEHRPDVVFHAAAHKHVPLMETSIQSAILNNVRGTYNLASLSAKYKVKRFVQISTDKAVNPTNVMGATKRIDEMIIQAFHQESDTEYVAVRFGNVLGSSGSVIPLFIEQIKEGGPVTVTHKDMLRYFMTIDEAAGLVLQAGSIAKGGEIFILDMGEPVKIVNLAENVIRLSGFVPYKDIDIEFVGMRPGEKLKEELILNKDTATKTAFSKIFIDTPSFYPLDELDQMLEPLYDKVHHGTKEEIKAELKKIVTNYCPIEKEEGNYETAY